MFIWRKGLKNNEASVLNQRMNMWKGMYVLLLKVIHFLVGSFKYTIVDCRVVTKKHNQVNAAHGIMPY